ncbi:hypothetical protein RIF29_26872 [Crotalaria pallida]|uniref:Pentatricopeptide repeat protein n=1 Tax=Crotalaria pallida TaxID=3830 RepID=A0AAN9EQE7_CROPI
MNTWSSWHPKCSHLAVPPVSMGFEIGSSSVSVVPNRRSRRIKLGFVFPIFHSTIVGVLHCSISSKFVTLFKPNKCHVGGGFALLEFEEKAIGNELVEGQTDSTGRTSVNSVSEGVKSSLDLDHVRDDNNSEEKVLGRRNGDEDGKEECDGKIDVRELAMSLQSAKTVDDVEVILKGRGDLPLQVYSTVIKGFGKDKRMDSAFVLFDWMKMRKMESNGSFGPNLFIYNSLLGVVKQSEQFGFMESILNEMAQDGITYNVVTYNTLMSIYIEKGEGENALNMLEEIHRNGLTPSPVSYSQNKQVEALLMATQYALRLRAKLRE